MKHYLDLVPIQAKVRRKQNRLTKLCIALAVFLVTGIFSMADMEILAEKEQAIQTDGSWHLMFRDLDSEQQALLAARPEVSVGVRYYQERYRQEDSYQINGVPAMICGMDESLFQIMPYAVMTEGHFPSGASEMLCTESVRARFGCRTGDKIALTLPDGSKKRFTVSGFFRTDTMFSSGDALGAAFDTDSFLELFPERNGDRSEFYVQFRPFCNIQRTLDDICAELDIERESVGQNAKLLLLMFQSRDTYLARLYLTAAALAVLVMVSGVLMITGSLNSNVAQRTEFFGMLRCLGADRRQIRRFVRREAFYWCRSAFPAGILAGTAVTWGLCAVLRYLSPHLFEHIPVFGISYIGIGAGLIVGSLTVLFAAHAPARRAAGVSPLTAVSGNSGTIHEAKRAANTKLWRVETALGVHHAKGSRKNLLLMSGSFAFGVILFLSFGSMKDLMDHALKPLQPYSPDLSVYSEDYDCSLPAGLEDEYAKLPFVRRAYARSFAYDMPALLDGREIKVNLISYEEYQFGWAEDKDKLLAGSLDDVRAGKGVAFAYSGDSPISPGSLLTVETPAGTQSVPICAVLSDVPFDSGTADENVICSEELFEKLSGERGRTIIDLQVTRNTTEEDVQMAQQMAGEHTLFTDKRMSNAEVMGAYYAFCLSLYGFLAMILLISAVHIINSISMSVSARLHQYGAMRAVGMSVRQVMRMVAAEAFTYAILGLLIGMPAGLLIHRTLYVSMITSRWGDSWSLPAVPLLAAVSVVLLAAFLSLAGPAGRIRRMSVTDTLAM